MEIESWILGLQKHLVEHVRIEDSWKWRLKGHGLVSTPSKVIVLELKTPENGDWKLNMVTGLYVGYHR